MLPPIRSTTVSPLSSARATPSARRASCARTSATDCSGYRIRPRIVVLPATTEEVAACVRLAREHELADRAARRRDGALRRRAAGRRRHRHRHVAHERASSRSICVNRAHARAAGRDQPRHLQAPRAARLLLRARSVVAERVHDRRQRRREFRRRALPQVRLHRQPRGRRARRARRRQRRRHRRAATARPMRSATI